MNFCTRCKEDKPQSFFIGKSLSLTFGMAEDIGIGAPNPEYSCLECLTDLEMVDFLTPVALFVVETNLRERFYDKTGQKRHREGIEHFGYVEAWLRFRRGYDQGHNDREKSIKALRGFIATF